jgi:hypothetical protein
MGKLTSHPPRGFFLEGRRDCTSSTMELIPESCLLPYTFIDPSLGLCSLFDTLGLDIESSDVGWNSLMEKPIPQLKLHDLIVCTTFFLDGRNVKVQDSNRSIWRRDFVCTCCTNFQLTFKCSHPTKQGWQQPVHPPQKVGYYPWSSLRVDGRGNSSANLGWNNRSFWTYRIWDRGRKIGS